VDRAYAVCRGGGVYLHCNTDPTTLHPNVRAAKCAKLKRLIDYDPWDREGVPHGLRCHSTRAQEQYTYTRASQIHQQLPLRFVPEGGLGQSNIPLSGLLSKPCRGFAATIEIVTTRTSLWSRG